MCRGDLEDKPFLGGPDRSIELCIIADAFTDDDEEERLCFPKAIAADDHEQRKDRGVVDPLMEVSILRIIRFAVPVVGIWFCGPLLSVIDTSLVGMLSGTVQQAALQPAVAVTDYTARLMVRPMNLTDRHDENPTH
jgi:hypothetical protein